MTRENAATKGKRYLHQGRLIITEVNRDRITATCRGDGHIYHVSWHKNAWWCTCPARGRCAHLLAVGHVVAVDIEAAS